MLAGGDVPDRRGPGPFPVRLVALVAAGGAVGSVLRLVLTEALPDLGVTFAINVVGSLLLGALVVLSPADSWWRPFLGAGVLGGFTTFSGLAVQTIEAGTTVGSAYLVATVLLGTGAAALGRAVALRRTATP